MNTRDPIPVIRVAVCVFGHQDNTLADLDSETSRSRTWIHLRFNPRHIAVSVNPAQTKTDFSDTRNKLDQRGDLPNEAAIKSYGLTKRGLSPRCYHRPKHSPQPGRILTSTSR